MSPADDVDGLLRRLLACVRLVTGVCMYGDARQAVGARRIIPTVNAHSAEQARKLVAVLKSPSFAL